MTECSGVREIGAFTGLFNAVHGAITILLMHTTLTTGNQIHIITIPYNNYIQNPVGIIRFIGLFYVIKFVWLISG